LGCQTGVDIAPVKMVLKENSIISTV